MFKQLGLTLVELLVSLGLFSLILMSGLSFSPSLYKKNQLLVLEHDIRGAIAFAKISALASGDKLVLSHLPPSNDWSRGMILFVDNPKHICSPDSKILRKWHWDLKEQHVSWQGFQSKDRLIFAPDISQSAINGYFLLEDKFAHKKLILNRLGRVRIHNNKPE